MSNERIRLCDVIDKCEDCPRYADDCDGDADKTTDLISRADAIEAVIAQRHKAELSDYNFALGLAEDAIRHLPSAEAVQGEWIEKGGELVCSVCGNSVSFSRTPKGWVLGRFCQTCGAIMKGGDTE